MINAADFLALYQRHPDDEVLTPFTNDTGFSIVRKYPEGTPYNKDGMRMFIKLAILDRGFFYSIDMTLPRVDEGDDHISYSIQDGDKYKQHVTNFYSDTDPFEFDETQKKIVHTPTGKLYAVTEFINVLVTNHLSDRLYYKRKKNWIVEQFLKLIFWLDNRRFERIRVMLDKYRAENTQKVDTESNPDPFFKYFKIKKNILIVILGLFFVLITSSVLLPKWIPLQRWWIFGSFNLSNPYVVLCIFLVMLICEKFSVYLNSSIDYFFATKTFEKDKINWVEKLFNYSQKNQFELKL